MTPKPYIYKVRRPKSSLDVFKLTRAKTGYICFHAHTVREIETLDGPGLLLKRRIRSDGSDIGDASTTEYLYYAGTALHTGYRNRQLECFKFRGTFWVPARWRNAPSGLAGSIRAIRYTPGRNSIMKEFILLPLDLHPDSASAPEDMVRYAHEVIKGRWVEVEELICEEYDTAPRYFKKCLSSYIEGIDWSNPNNDFPIPQRIARILARRDD